MMPILNTETQLQPCVCIIIRLTAYTVIKRVRYMHTECIYSRYDQ